MRERVRAGKGVGIQPEGVERREEREEKRELGVESLEGGKKEKNLDSRLDRE